MKRLLIKFNENVYYLEIWIGVMIGFYINGALLECNIIQDDNFIKYLIAPPLLGIALSLMKYMGGNRERD